MTKDCEKCGSIVYSDSGFHCYQCSDRSLASPIQIEPGPIKGFCRIFNPDDMPVENRLASLPRKGREFPRLLKLA